MNKDTRLKIRMDEDTRLETWTLFLLRMCVTRCPFLRLPICNFTVTSSDPEWLFTVRENAPVCVCVFLFVLIGTTWRLGEAHGHGVLECFAAQWCDAAASPHVTVRRAAQLWRTAGAGRARQRCGHHAGEGGLVQVRLQARAVRRQAVRETHGVGRRCASEAALRQRLGHGRLATQRRRQLQLRHAGHSCSGPAAIVSVERAQTVTHRRPWKLRQTMCGQQGAGSAEHIRGLLALLPLSASVLKPNLQRKAKFYSDVKNIIYKKRSCIL